MIPLDRIQGIPLKHFGTRRFSLRQGQSLSGKYVTGFTLIEVMLSVSLIALIAGLAAPALFSLPARTDFDAAVTSAVGVIRRAEVRARGVNEDSPWGIRVESSGITLFSGSAYASRDPSLDEVTEFPVGTIVTGLSEIVFSKLRGEPSAVGSILLTSPTGKYADISINSKGRVQYFYAN